MPFSITFQNNFCNRYITGPSSIFNPQTPVSNPVPLPLLRPGYLLFCALQASASLCKHGQKKEAYTKKTISTHNWRVSKELAVFEGAYSFSPANFFAVPVTQKLINETTNSQNML